MACQVCTSWIAKLCTSRISSPHPFFFFFFAGEITGSTFVSCQHYSIWKFARIFSKGLKCVCVVFFFLKTMKIHTLKNFLSAQVLKESQFNCLFPKQLRCFRIAMGIRLKWTENVDGKGELASFTFLQIPDGWGHSTDDWKTKGVRMATE